MAGGSGTRFWPQSRKTLPKQLLNIAGDQTMIQETVARGQGLIAEGKTWIVTNSSQVAETARQVPNVPTENLLVEPCGKNTAPCVGLAAINLLHQDPEAVMLVMPADHVIKPLEVFQQAAQQAVNIVEHNEQALVLFGVPPTYPAEGFGYIERGSAISETDSPAFAVNSFEEKPDRETAQVFLDSGNYYWNCGIFVWKAKTILQMLQQFEPEIYDRLLTIQNSLETDSAEAVLAAEFPEMKAISIDHAVLERASEIFVLEAPYEWDDVGSWQALPRLLGSDKTGNTVDGLHAGVETNGCIIRSTEEGHLVGTIGVDDLVIVHTPDATLVARKDDEAGIRELVKKIEEQGDGRFL